MSGTVAAPTLEIFHNFAQSPERRDMQTPARGVH